MIFLYILGVIVIVLVVLMAFAPKHYAVSRSITIARPRTEVYTYLKSVKNQDNWSPWKKKDPEIRLLSEMLVRAYDPCISCATHFLTLRIDRG